MQEISSISRGLKMLARDLEVPIICVSQLNRAPDARNDKRPMLSDLRESGAIEQDADLVLMIYRDDYYNPTTPRRRASPRCIVAKNRHGPTDRVKLTFRGSYAKFDNLAREEVSADARDGGDRRPVGRRGQGQGGGPAGRAQRRGRALPGRQQRRAHDRGRRQVYKLHLVPSGILYPGHALRDRQRHGRRPRRALPGDRRRWRSAACPWTRCASGATRT